MPIAVDPNSTYDYVLEGDRDKEKPPSFTVKYLVCSKWKEVAMLHDEFKAADGVGEQLDAAAKTIKIALAGWKNMPNFEGTGMMDYNPDVILDLLTLTELTELMRAILHQSIEPDDKKKLESPSDSNTEEFAQAAKDTLNAETSPPKPNQSPTPQ